MRNSLLPTNQKSFARLLAAKFQKPMTPVIPPVPATH